MKTLIILLAILYATASQAQHTIKNPDRPLIYGDLNVGYSNYGLCGEATLNYQESGGLFSLAYYKSHVCYTGSYNGIPFPKTGSDEHHMAVNSLSLSRGFVIGKKRTSILSIGLSATKFDFEETEVEHDELSLNSIIKVLTGNENDEEVISSRSHVVVGIPVAFRRQFGGKHGIGGVAGLKVDLNPEKVFVAATLGLRIGRSK